jgi:hypothetical protein
MKRPNIPRNVKGQKILRWNKPQGGFVGTTGTGNATGSGTATGTGIGTATGAGRGVGIGTGTGTGIETGTGTVPSIEKMDTFTIWKND